MKSFAKHVFRSGIRNLGTLAGAACIIALGIFIYVGMMDTLANLKVQVDKYYQDSNMADVFAVVEGISSTELERLKEIPGISQVSGKMAVDARILAPNQREIVSVHLLSYDENDALNQLKLSSQSTASGGLFLGSKMAAEGGYEPGTELTLLMNGTGKKTTLQGTCYAPDYIYVIPPGGTLIPDGEIYDIACIDETKMEELTGKQDSYQELGFRLKPGYSFEDVRYRLADSLRSKGIYSLMERADQFSYQMIDTEIKGLVSMGNALPMMFLAISVFMLYVVLKKVVDRDQSVIGTMKAMGMGDGELISVYMVQGVLVGIAGSIIGSVVAIPFGNYMFGMYVEFFNLPVSTYHNYPDSRLKGLILAVTVCAAAVYLGVRGILEITPAQAMRAKAPKAAVSLKIPNIILKKMGTMERLGCRAIARNPFRGCLIVLAIGFPFSMASVMYSFEQLADQMFYSQFNKVQTYDMQISLAGNISPIQAANTGSSLRGVTGSEGVAQLVVEIMNQNRSEFSVLYCLNKNSEFWKIMDLHDTYYQPPDDGLLVNSRIAEKLQLQKGDRVEIICTGLTPEPIKLTVVDIIEESLGGGSYISKEGLTHYFNTAGIADTILLKVKPGQEEEVRSQLLGASGITWLVDTARIMKGYRVQMQSATIMMNMFALMAAVAGGILIYNISLINIRERILEFGTIVLMGGTHRELGRILIFEQTLYFIFGIMLGIPGSFGVKYVIENISISDEYTIDMVVKPDSYFKALVICFAITAVTFLAQMRVLGKIKIADVLKGRE